MDKAAIIYIERGVGIVLAVRSCRRQLGTSGGKRWLDTGRKRRLDTERITPMLRT